MSDYKPVSCDFYDDFTAAATTRQDVELEFEMNGETRISVRTWSAHWSEIFQAALTWKMSNSS